MKNDQFNQDDQIKSILVTSILWIFFIQLFSDFIESVYIFALMTLSLNINVLSVLFFLSPVVLFFLVKIRKLKQLNIIIQIGNLVMILARLIEPLLDTQGRMIVSGLGLGAFLITFPLILTHLSNQKQSSLGKNFAIGLPISINISILFRVLGSSIDITTIGWFQLIAWILAGFEILFLNQLLTPKNSTFNPLNKENNTKITSTNPLLPILSILGLWCVFLFLYFVFSSPIILTRWTEANYFMMIIGYSLPLTIFLVIRAVKSKWFKPVLKPGILIIINTLFILSLIITIKTNQVSFPTIANRFPIIIAQSQWWHQIPLVIVLVTYPILCLDLEVFFDHIIQNQKLLFKLAIGFTLGGILSLIFIFALIFTSVWGFVPPVSFYLRDQFWTVFLILGLILFTIIIYASVQNKKKWAVPSKITFKTIFSVFLIVICLGTILTGYFTHPRPSSGSEPIDQLKILTYNVQQGVNDEATKNYEGQLALLREIDADIIGLQESSKIAGNSDIVRYFAEKLDMYSYFGPRGVTGTTGVALLSKFPIIQALTLYHYNTNADRKQTATIEAEIEVDAQVLTIYITHTFGSMDAKTLLVSDILARAAEKNHTLFIGDFNFREDSEAYNLTITEFTDAWVDQWPTRVDDTGVNATRRIDHLFVSPDVSIIDCRYEDWEETQSDHPAGWVQIMW